MKRSKAPIAFSPSANGSTSTAGVTSVSCTPTTRTSTTRARSQSSRTTTISTTRSTGCCYNSCGPAIAAGGSWPTRSTGLASRTGGDLFHGPGRGGGNSINALLDAWLLGAGRAYLDKAEELIRRCVHPADDLAALDLGNPEERWSYTVFLSVLARYLDLKARAGQIDEMFS